MNNTNFYSMKLKIFPPNLLKNGLGLFALLAFFIGISGCSENKLEIDTSNITVSLEVERMEIDLFNSNMQSTEKHQILQQKYGDLYTIFFESMLREGSIHDPMAPTYLQKFVENEDMQAINSSIQSKFADFGKYQTELNEAFKRYRYYFPDSTLPKIVTFYSNFNSNIFPINNTLGIGLDMYLGPESEIVSKISTELLPQFIKNKMKEEYLVSDAMKFWLFNRFYQEGSDFLSTIIATGKIMYLLDAMLPTTEDRIKMDYAQTDIDWCQQNESNIWKNIVDNDILYSKDQKVIMQYITDGPFTKGLPEDSPSRVGFWLGWQMVRDYMNKSDVSVVDLLAEKNDRKILKEYNPNE